MALNGKSVAFAAIGVVAVIGIAIGGYFLVLKVDEVHEENVDQLASFGSVVIPMSQQQQNPDGITTGVDGQQQLPPTIGDKKLSASEKIIVSLSQEKEELVAELTSARNRIQSLETEVAMLRNYKDTNERFAPRLMEEERERAVSRLTEFLESSRDASRFSDFQKQAMAQDSANTYVKVLKQYNLSIKEEQKEKLLSQHLPPYAFCVGASLEFVANNRREEVQVLHFLRTSDTTALSISLQNDIDTIRSPCIKELDARISKLL